MALQTIPPRLAHLLNILLASGSPVPVAQLAKSCGVSRRTIFREMGNIDGLLKPYGLNLGTKAGEGVYLSGGGCGKDKLREALGERSASRPTGRGERRAFLALDLLAFGEAQKLSYYADIFQTSEATISYDLNSVEEKLSGYGVTVSKNPARGVTVGGDETSVRNAICAILSETLRSDAKFSAGYPPEDISSGVAQLMATRFKHLLDWMTEESKEALAVYMTVAADRIASGNTLAWPPSEASVPCLPMADFFANSLELKFSVVFSEWERKNLALRLSALRKAASASKGPGEPANDFFLKSLAYQMIEHFDPELSPFLKLDDRLVDGLTLHMRAAVVRVKNRIELYDPLYDEIARTYPGILAKSERSLKALREYSSRISKSEASFLATHFGAAVMRIRERTARRLRAAVVCGGGIGTSYLMVSQLKKHFAPLAEFEIYGLGDVTAFPPEDWGRFDLCVTSMPLSGAPIPTVRVNLLLEDSDVETVRRQIESIQTELNSASEKKISAPGKPPLLELCKNAAAVLSDADALLTYFDTVTIESDCDFDRLAKLAGYRFGGLEKSGRLIYDDIIKRENLSTQVVPSLELILLHTRTDGVKSPVFSLIVPEDGRFTSPALQNARCCVVMLAPLNASRDTLGLMGSVSSALLEDASFLNAVLTGDYKGVYRGLEENFRDYLAANISFGKE